MQNFKNNFQYPDGSQRATLQSCIRTNDLSLLGDGSHLSLFHMLGNFHFGRPEDPDNYKKSVFMWDEIMKKLNIPITSVHIHPTQLEHRKLWENLHYTVIEDSECEWSDGNIGGYCCELYIGDLEVGNLVNTLGYSVDVGFGFERLIQIIENKSRVDETSLFDQTLHPVLKDVSRTLDLLWEYQVNPGWKGRYQVCRDLLRTILPYINDSHQKFKWYPWIISEKESIRKKTEMGRRVFYRHREKPISWFMTTYGISEYEYWIIRKEFTDDNGNIVRKTIDG